MKLKFIFSLDDCELLLCNHTAFFLRFLSGLKTSPDARPPVKFIQNEQHLYVMQRYRETHDFNHILLEMPTHMLGEVRFPAAHVAVILKWFS